MPEPLSPPGLPVEAAAIDQAHQLYCQLTGQSLRLAFDRERMWYELLRLGYSLQDLRAVILYPRGSPNPPLAAKKGDHLARTHGRAAHFAPHPPPTSQSLGSPGQL